MTNAELIAKMQEARSPVMEAGALSGGTVKWCTLCHGRWLTDRVEGELHELTCPWPLFSQLAAALAQTDAALAARWQDISTCPKGRIVLMFAVTDIADDGTIRNWKMATGSYAFSGDSLEWDGRRVDKPYKHRPTHWVPLPPPPRTDRET